MGDTGRVKLRGRIAERAALDDALDRVRIGESAVLVLRGEPGIGKTSLLEYVAHVATSSRVVRIAGVQSELELPFAGLHQICAPLLAEVDTVPEHQERALRVALGLAGGPPPDRLVVGLAVLSVFAEVARDKPLVVLVDDAQWLDEATCQVLGLVARRMGAESVLLVLGVRESGEEHMFRGVQDLTLQGLEGDDARDLLVAATPGLLDEKVRERLIAETGGNPWRSLSWSTG